MDLHITNTFIDTFTNTFTASLARHHTHLLTLLSGRSARPASGVL